MTLHRLAQRFRIGSRDVRALGMGATALTLVLSRCQSSEPLAVTTPTEENPAQSSAAVTSSQTSQVLGEPIVSDHALIPGRHCYSVESAAFAGAISLTVTEDDKVTGNGKLNAENDGISPDFGPTYQAFSGTILKDILTLDRTNYVQEDRLTELVTWRLQNDQLSTEQTVYEKVDCSVVEAQLADAKQFIKVMSSSSYELKAKGLTDAH